MALGNLPVRLSSFVGRESELDEVGHLVKDARLVTLTGPGGSGKSRLALAVAHDIEPHFPNGVWWAGLAPLVDPRTVLPAVVDALRLPEVAGVAPIDSIAARLAGGPALLVLDNCEHLIAAAVELLERLLTGCPELRVLVTSQEALGTAGEVIFAVPPLPLPDADTTASAVAVGHSAAVRLFTERARAAWHGFELTDANAADVALVCQRLDGIPLAIELAAARVALLSPAQIAAKLDDCLRVLVGGSRGALPRHRAMQAAMDWSWQLLAEPERRLLARLSVFAGGFTLDAVEAIAGAADLDVLQLLSQLVNRSLVLVQQGAQVRYRLLQTVRQYANERLAEEGSAAQLHARFYIELVERAATKLDGAEQQDWLETLAAERDNVRAALRWCRHHHSAEGALRLATAQWWACYLRGNYSEGREWLEDALRTPGDVPAGLRAKALVASGTLAHLQGDYQLAPARLQAGLAVYRELGDQRGVAGALRWLGGVAMRRGHYAEARRLDEESLALWQGMGDEPNVTRSLDYLSLLALLADDPEWARELCSRAHASYQQSGDGEGLAWTTVHLGAVALYRGEQVVARTWLTEGLEQARAGGYSEAVAWALNHLGVLAQRAGNTEQSRQLLQESLRRHRDIGNRWRAASVLEALAGTAVGQREQQRAARLLGCSAALREVMGTPVPAVEQTDVARTTMAVRAALGPSGFTEHCAAGQIVRFDQLVDGELAADVPRWAPAPAPVITIAEVRIEPLRILALGAARVYRDATLLGPADWGYAKPRELLYYLLAETDASKEGIGAALWPEASTSTLRNSFHTSLHQLRRALGRSDRIIFCKGRYAFNRTLDYTYDAERFDAALAGADVAGDPAGAVRCLSEAVELYKGDYLGDMAGAEWIEVRRAALRQAFEYGLLKLARLHSAQGRHAEAAALYQRAVEHDGLLEQAHRELIACYLRMGDRGRAVRQYHSLVELLADELGVGPSPETMALHHALLEM